MQPVPDVKPGGFAEPPAGSGLARYEQQKLDWKPCDEKYQCTTVLAPLDYANPDAQALTLALKKKSATAQPRLGTLFINPGGPGGSGQQYVTFFRSTGLEAYDIVGWDPRGVSGSTPVKCFTGERLDRYNSIDVSPDDAGEEKALLDEQVAFGRSCLERSGALLQHISTTETVQDLDLLRGLVGDDRLTYLGSSYGTKIGALYAELFPATVGRLVLDGAVNITEDESVSQIQGFDRALTAFAKWCANRKCALGDTSQEVLKSITDLWTDLDQDPLPAGERDLSQQEGVNGVLFVLYEDQRAWRYLLEALENAINDGDGAYLLFLSDQFNQRNKDGAYGQISFSFPAIRCRDSQDTSVSEAWNEAERDAEKAPIIGPFGGADLVCPLWPVPPAPAQPTIDGNGAAPVVVIGTTGDPATPYEYAVSMAEQLESGVLVTYQGTGHLAYGGNDCINAVVVDYLVKGSVPANGKEC